MSRNVYHVLWENQPLEQFLDHSLKMCISGLSQFICYRDCIKEEHIFFKTAPGGDTIS